MNKRNARRWLNVRGPNDHPIRITVSRDGSSIVLQEKHSRKKCVLNATVLSELMEMRARDEAEAARISRLQESLKHHPVFPFFADMPPAPPPAATSTVGSQSCDAPTPAPHPPSVDSVPDARSVA